MNDIILQCTFNYNFIKVDETDLINIKLINIVDEDVAAQSNC